MHNHDHHAKVDSNPIKGAFILNLLFTIIEIVGGFWTNSVAILSDALHDLGDSLSLGLAWYFQKLSGKGRDRKFSYGYKRFSLLGAIVNSVILLLGSFYIISESIPRIIDPQETDSLGMLYLAIGGVLINGLAVLRLRRGHSINEKVVSLHLLEDVLGWSAILVGSVVIYFTEWYIIDPILSLAIAVFILINIYKNIKSSIRIILQGVPTNINVTGISEALKNIDGVKSEHDLHIWTMDGERNILTVHLVVENDLKDRDRAAIKSNVYEEMHDLGIDHCTIELESEAEDCELIDC